METNTVQTKKGLENAIITSSDLLNHWQGHRRLTRQVIETFPEEELFAYSVGGMRSFAELAMEMIRMVEPGVRGVLAGKWATLEEMEEGKLAPKTKKELLQLWDKATEQIDELWPQIPAERFREVDTAFGQYEDTNYATVFYFIDNEIHHRRQGYVYLRALGIEPPFFWER